MALTVHGRGGRSCPRKASGYLFRRVGEELMIRKDPVQVYMRHCLDVLILARYSLVLLVLITPTCTHDKSTATSEVKHCLTQQVLKHVCHSFHQHAGTKKILALENRKLSGP